MPLYKVSYIADVNSYQHGKFSVRNSIELEAGSSDEAEQDFIGKTQDPSFLRQLEARLDVDAGDKQGIYRVKVNGRPVLV